METDEKPWFRAVFPLGTGRFRLPRHRFRMRVEDTSSSILPWRSLQRVCMAQLLVWFGSFLVVLLDPCLDT